MTGTAAVTVHTADRALLRTLPNGVTEVSGTLSVGSEIENDGTLRAVAGGTLAQFGTVAAPADSGGVFDAQDTGVLSFSNVLMGAASTATGNGTIRFAGGTSRVAPGAGYAAGITDINAGTVDFDDDGTTVALRMAGEGTRRGDGTLTVGNGQSSLGLSNFFDPGTTAFTANSNTTITSTIDFFAAGHTLRLNGTTTWSAGTIQIQAAGTVENAGLLQVTGTAAVTIFTVGRALLRTLPTGVTEVSGSLSVGSEIENDGTLRAVDGGTLSPVGQRREPGRQRGSVRRAGNGGVVVQQRADGCGVDGDRQRHDPVRGRDQSAWRLGPVMRPGSRTSTRGRSTSTTTAPPSHCGCRGTGRVVAMGR